MQKYVTASLFIFGAIIMAVMAAGLVFSNKINQLNNPVNNPAPNLKLSTTELAKHHSAQSCWLLIAGKIYDVTTFLNQHPGDARTILPACGTDATVAYNTKGWSNGRSHSRQADAILADYYIGNLNQIIKIL